AAFGKVRGGVHQHAAITRIGDPEVSGFIEGHTNLERPVVAGSQRDAICVDQPGGRIGRALIQTHLADYQVRDQLVRRNGERFAKTEHAVVEAVRHVKIAAWRYGHAGGPVQSRRKRGSGASWESGEKVALADDQVGRLAIREAGRVFPGEHAVIARVADV